jgi:hypothetical protein
MKGNCIVCNEEIEVQMCCSGRDCGCMGQPIEPPVCSDKCYDELMNNLDKYYPKNEQVQKFVDTGEL